MQNLKKSYFPLKLKQVIIIKKHMNHIKVKITLNSLILRFKDILIRARDILSQIMVPAKNIVPAGSDPLLRLSLT